MATVTREDRFHGTCNLVILHLRRAARSTDLEAGFSKAREMHMLTSEQEAFVRKCLDTDERIQSGEGADMPVTDELIRELQAHVLRLNTADPA